MKHAALTAKYRPQTFAQVAGQETVKTILSRASLESRVAPAYLFSGTRGVGKTTLARIFAKALNCRKGPAAEPCNECDQCRAITAGSAVDVVEIDGASNRGIDDVRRLKEVVGYAPMEGRYKIFIIDEAHMLSREAFNALLKTLEEPPAGVTFIMATTEPHKFPATIISRCQHFVFKRLPEAELAAHLQNVLSREQVPFEESAVRLIVRRGAGSVRDSMSLLGQVLALGEGALSESSARGVLGLAGQEAFMQLLEAIQQGDALRLSKLLRVMLDQGLDMGFFLRELSSFWRALFMLRQSGEAALPVVDLPDNEAKACLALSQNFTLAHIHACWQMTLEGQRRVLTSLEPALALELLLLNLAMLPKLLSLENLSAAGRRAGPPPSSGQGPGQGPGHSGVSGPAPKPLGDSSGPVRAQSDALQKAAVPAPPAEHPEKQETAAQTIPASDGADSPETVAAAEDKGPIEEQENSLVENDAAPEAPLSAEPLPEAPPGAVAPQTAIDDADDDGEEAGEDYSESDIQQALASLGGPESVGALFPEPCDDSPDAAAEEEPQVEPLLLDSLFALCEERETPVWLTTLLHRMEAGIQEEKLVLLANDEFTAQRLNEPKTRELLDPLLEGWCGQRRELVVTARKSTRKTRDALQAELLEHSLVKNVQNSLGARMLDFGQMLR